ncbi:hypothetical protein CW736_04120 [Nonlabens sp. MB-3u-79]|uniref:fibronectin type III domain-containing protein n=1 Tax=Nonlabens sp. MB-3u-79 TaxID=2058134 RepID=UPI000C305D4B|nr:fibronectin type III domain-containing protein [Nonlabens sp. MB-3u-79]AUC78629.1 hypothetical protein CW736_04120 [Nonlabens sp. MB-3u-79]
MKLKLLLSTLVIVAFGIFSSAQSTINITTTGGSFTTEKWVNITDMADGAGTQIWGQGDGTYGNAQGLINQDIMLTPGTYWVNCYDRYADGWDGTTIDVTAYGASIGNNGGTSPDDGTNNDATSGWETPADELEASFMIVVPSPPACTVPSNVVLNNATDITATMDWTDSSTEDAGYNWEVVPDGDAQGVNVITSGTTAADAITVNITGLTQNTAYSFYLQSNCGAGTSTYVGPISFSTLCSPVAAAYTEDFELFTTSTSAFASGNCWAGTGGSYYWESAPGTDNGSSGTGPDPSITTGNYFYTEASGGAIGDTTDLVSPLVDLTALTAPALSFNYHMFGNEIGTLDVLVNGTTNVWSLSGQQQTSDTAPWGIAVVDLAAYVGQTISITFRATSAGTFEGDLAIDNVVFDEAPSCFAPTNVLVTATSIDGATIDFTNANTSTNTNVEYGAPGFVQGTGTPVSYTTIPFSLTGLMSATTYDFYLQSDCGMGDLTAWAGPFSFTTDCVAVAVFAENFDGVSTPNLPVCWNSFSSPVTGTAATVITNTVADNTAPNGVRLYSGGLTGNIGSGTASEGETILVSPELNNLAAGTHRVRFFADAGTATSTLEVGTITDPSDPSTFTSLSAIAPTTTHSEFIVNFDSYTGTDQYVAFRHIFAGTFDSMYLDNIAWEAIPSCPDTSNLTLASNTDVTATINFDSGNATSAGNYEYSLTTVAGTAPAVSGSWSDIAGANPNVTYTITGLTAETEYFVHVREVCAVGDESVWSPVPVNFTTACTTLIAPYTQDFENAGAVPNCWTLGGDEDWVFNLTGPNHVGNAGTLSGSTASGNYYAVLDDSSPDAADGQLNSPLVDVSGLSAPALSFYEISDNEGNASATLTVSVWDGAAWNVMGTYNTNTAGWELKIIDLSTLTFTGAAQARFSIADSGSFYDDIAIDDVSFNELPTCNNVSAVTIDSVTGDSVTVSWTENNVPLSTAWEVIAVPAGDPAPVVGTTNTTATPYTVTGLASSTAYDIYVRADCSTTFVGPLGVTTSAVCGDTVYDTGGVAGDYSNNESYTFTYLPDTAANVVTLDFTLVDLENCCDTLTIYDGLDTSAAVLEADLENPAVFSALNPSGAITIEFTSDFSVTRAGWEANYTCTPRPSCVDVSGLIVDSVTTDSATLSWTENNIPAGTAWEVVAVVSGGPAPVAGTSNATTNPYTIASLTANTSYDVYVRADCSTTFVGPISLTTSCAIVTTYPYTTDFTNNVPNACWDEAGSGEITDGPMTVGSSDWKAGRSYENFAGTATPSNLVNLYSNNDREWLLSESYDMSGTSNDVLSIEVAVTDYQFSGASNATDTDTMGSDDQVDLLITTDGGMTWISLMTWTAANQPSVTGTREFIDLSSYTGTVQFAFFATDGTVNDPEDYDFHVGMFIIDGTAGNEDVFESTLSLYPNPVNGDVVTISMDQRGASSVEVVVFNTLGQQVMTRSFDQVNHTINIDNISSLSKGMYFVRLSSGTQQATLKFIKE